MDHQNPRLMDHQVSQDPSVDILRPGTAAQSSPSVADSGVYCCYPHISHNLFLASPFSRQPSDLSRKRALSRQMMLATACSQTLSFPNGSGPSLAGEADMDLLCEKSVQETVSWSEDATPKQLTQVMLASGWANCPKNLRMVGKISSPDLVNPHP